MQILNRIQKLEETIKASMPVEIKFVGCDYKPTAGDDRATFIQCDGVTCEEVERWCQ
jgi:hypothetical protein